MFKNKLIVSCILILAEAGCTSSIKSEKIVSESEIDKGIVYYMPKRDIRFDIKVSLKTQDNSGSSSGAASSTTSPGVNVVYNNVSPQALTDDEILKRADQINKKKDAANLKAKQDLVKNLEKAINTSDLTEKAKINSLLQAAEKKDKVIADKIYQVSVTLVNNYSSETYPDLTKRYLLRYSKNIFADNNVGISVSNSGLLTITHGEKISRVNEIGANLAVDAADIAAGGGILGPTTTNKAALGLLQSIAAAPGYSLPTNNSVTFITNAQKCKEGNYSVTIDPSKPLEAIEPSCGISFTVDKTVSPKEGSSNEVRNVANAVTSVVDKAIDTLDILHPNNTSSSESGVYYRQDRPYFITTCIDSSTKCGEQKFVFVAFSPNESNSHLAPIARTFFADNSSEVSLVNGVITGVKQNTASELLAASQIPSTILGNYTDAVGKVFSSLSGILTNKNNYQTTQAASLESASKLQLCKIAIAANSLVGKSSADATVAYQNIIAACGN